MNQPFRPSGSPAAFTLLELLVAMVILALLAVLIAQLVEGTTKTSTASRKRMDADRLARLIFDKMAVDFSRMVRRGDVDIFAKGTTDGGPMPGNDKIAFYSAVDGYFPAGAGPSRTGRNSASLAGYAIATDSANRPQLLRLSKGLGWEPGGTSWQSISFVPSGTNPNDPNNSDPWKNLRIAGKWPDLWNAGPPTGMADDTFQVIGSDIMRLEYSYLLKPVTGTPAVLSVSPYNSAISGHTARDFYRDVAAIIVTIVIMDPTSRVIISDYSKLTDNSLFADAVNGVAVDKQWGDAVLKSDFASSAGIPQAAASAVRVYQRAFYLNPSPL